MGQEDIFFFNRSVYFFILEKMGKNGDWQIVSKRQVLFSKPLHCLTWATRASQLLSLPVVSCECPCLFTLHPPSVSGKSSYSRKCPLQLPLGLPAEAEAGFCLVILSLPKCTRALKPASDGPRASCSGCSSSWKHL